MILREVAVSSYRSISCHGKRSYYGKGKILPSGKTRYSPLLLAQNPSGHCFSSFLSLVCFFLKGSTKLQKLLIISLPCIFIPYRYALLHSLHLYSLCNWITFFILILPHLFQPNLTEVCPGMEATITVVLLHLLFLVLFGFFVKVFRKLSVDEQSHSYKSYRQYEDSHV